MDSSTNVNLVGLISIGDAASRVTLMGLAANVGLTVLKGAAGWYLNSAALIADAGHSLSGKPSSCHLSHAHAFDISYEDPLDLIADFVTLSTILLSQKPPSSLYPLGYGKFESLGTVTVSIFLLLGGIGIGAHSWGMLTETLASKLSASPNMPPLLAHIVSYLAPGEATSSQDYGHSHNAPLPADSETLSPTAVLFPLFGILVKEYLYRVTKRVADEQNSSVLMANALHHRSDAYGSIVTVVAILGSLVLKDVPFDPMGGMFDVYLAKKDS
jgi:divalent metal cation (Fe/Co/Zn/Cd) transporter